MLFVKSVVDRIIVLFLVLSIFPFPLQELPFIGQPLSQAYLNVWDLIIQSFAHEVLEIKKTLILPNGSSDTTWNWIQSGFIIGIAVLWSIAWIWLAPIFERFKWLQFKPQHIHLLIRYFLIATLFKYGFVKLTPLQFGFLDPDRLYSQLGDMSSMSILWNMMAHSRGYQIFAGSIEILAGIFLLFRTTSTLGALIAFGVLSNIFFLNLCYEIPAKRFSLLLVFLSFYLWSAEGKRLWNFFIARTETQSVKIKPHWTHHRYQHFYWPLKLSVILLCCLPSYSFIQIGIKALPKPKLTPPYGVYQILSSAKKPQQLSIDLDQWDMIYFTYPKPFSLCQVTLRNHTKHRFNYRFDHTNKLIYLTPFGVSTSDHSKSSEKPLAFNYTLNKKGEIHSITEIHLIKYPIIAQNANIAPSKEAQQIENFRGTLNKKQIPTSQSRVLTLKLLNPSKFYLVNSKVKWIQEYPERR